MQEPRTYEEFWPYYVSQHLDPRCRACHLTGTVWALGLLATAPVMPPNLLAAPVVGYGMSWIGHFLFERNRPASWHSGKYFAWSFRSDFRMLRYTLTGRMQGEIARARAVSP
jgi:hypothetical protein